MNIDFIEALEEMAKEKGIARDDLYEAIKHGLGVAYRMEHNIDEAEKITVEIDRNSGDILINKEQIELTSFGRVATKKAEETIRHAIINKKREIIYDLYSHKIGTIIGGLVHRFERRDVWINLGETEALLPEEERVPGERYRPGERLRAYVVSVQRTQGDPLIILSRSHPGFVHQLLRLEVPEVEDGTLVVRRIAREAGRRSKVAVESLDNNVDAVGSCVGAGGARVRMITRELNGEKIDLIHWSEDIKELIKRSLAPAAVISITIDETTRSAKVIVPDDELSLAIGKGGQNVRLTAKLTQYNIDVTSPKETGILLDSAA
ncbi:transcription termination factor NusA [Candidatus Acetothermia bacterium]|jgi:N utilization substance protein A|nr:transcription termination factor NusA [Candidatus Acetothermia bacterium]MCI2427764.1 transcription termination factor NusA [Candidatus Acetothermia bacterium]MCI2428294.1 transcription termination factor NusA [Candidatus Acetothermia bacterium]